MDTLNTCVYTAGCKCWLCHCVSSAQTTGYHSGYTDLCYGFWNVWHLAYWRFKTGLDGQRRQRDRVWMMAPLHLIKPDEIQSPPITHQRASLALVCLSIPQAPRSTSSTGLPANAQSKQRLWGWRLQLKLWLEPLRAFAHGMSTPQHQAENNGAVELACEAMVGTTDRLARAKPL